ncbi:MAG: hypothetical protein ACKVRP_12885 [Bacteroidota bacterium]
MKRVKRIVYVCMTIFTLSVSAQAGGDGSAYSIFGLGDLRYMTNARGMAMGYTGIGLSGSSFINSLSPATWSRINNTRLDAGLLYEGFNSSNGTRSLYRANGDFNGALLAIPASPSKGIVVVGGFVPYSNISYATFTTGTQAGVNYSLNHVGTGGLSRGLIGLSYAPLPELAVGASMDYIFGSIDHTRLLTATTTSFVPLSGGTTIESMTLSGITATLGGIFTGFGEVAEPLRPLALGIVVTSRGTLNSTRQYFYQYVGERDSSAESEGIVTLPLSFGAGLSYQVGERYLVSADYFTQAWRNSEFFGTRPTELRNSYRIGIGGERMGTREPGAAWFDRLSYRAGFTYHATYLRINNEPINEWAVTGGIGIPFGYDGRINLAMEYGQRGLIGNNLVKDNIIRFTVGLSLSEQWFVRFEEE